jgi:CheY-like chemotaxis protein
MEKPTPKRVLVVEDREEMRQFIVEVLQDEGCQVLVPVDSYVALSLARQQAFDLVTLDLALPLIDGATFVRALRELGIPAPVLVIAANAKDPRIRQVRDLGVRHVLHKPFRREQLQSAAREILNGPPPTPAGT